jgi:DNA-binding PadR family transcriptional regulator
MSKVELTTTSYAILGLLAVKPWTTYALAKQMDRSLGRMWPRARSKIYEEPRKLVALGLARATREAVGRRPRTVYAITAKGRRTLAAWLRTPGGGPVLEFESLLKVFFADQTTRDDTRATIASIKQWADADRALHVDTARAYLAGEAPFQERLAHNLLTGMFLYEFSEMVRRWAAWADGVVSRWPDDPRDAEPDLDALRRIDGV